MSHDFVDLFLHAHHGTLGQMHINKRGSNPLMPQECLNYSQMNTGLHKMGGVRMSQRVAIDILLYFALPNGGLQTALHTVGGNGQSLSG